MAGTVKSKAVLKALTDVIDPELGCNIVDLGLIYDIEIEGGKVMVTMTMTTPGCPATGYLAAAVRQRVKAIDGVAEAEVQVVWMPPWTPDRMSDAAKRQLGMI